MDGIVLLAKKPGETSFSSLFSVKKALNTNKVGHTGTLDSFAQGLLVVCVGKLTKLAGNITEFNKSYSAIIKFGEETDTLEYTGKVIKTATLPTLDSLKNVLMKYHGPMEQIPPSFSAIHVNGKRASDLIREGKTVEIKSRKINIFENKLIDYKLNKQGLVEYCQINFSVSKGTYIRSIARDIANDLNSAGHLVGLYRTKVGNFEIEDACGYNFLTTFNIENAIKEMNNYNGLKKAELNSNEDLELKNQIKKNIIGFSKECASTCGFDVINLKEDYSFDFINGKPILYQWFYERYFDYQILQKIAVFMDNKFIGLIERKDKNHSHYIFVNNN